MIPLDLVAQEYELVDVDQLSPHPENPRSGDGALIGELIDENGFYGAVVAQRSSGHVLAGNHRLVAARERGAAMLPVLWLDVDDDRARRILLGDNRASDKAGYDTKALAELLRKASETDGGLAGTGWTEADLAELLGNAAPPDALTDPDDVPVPPRSAVSIEGDVWLLGPHRLAVGDSTRDGVAAAALGGRHADLLWTDPPYGVSYQGGTAEKLTIANDDLSASALGELLEGAFAVAHSALKPGGAFYVCGPSGALETTFRLALDSARLPLRTQIVWVKDRFVLGRADYHGQHETILYGWRLDGEPHLPPHYDPEHDTILYGWKGGAAHEFAGGRKQSTVWECPRPARSEDHPTMKPVALVARAIQNSCPPGGRVLDLFAGSGSALIACHSTGRVGAMVELDPKYADVICRRYQEHTGVVPVLERTGREVDFVARAKKAA